MWLSDDGEEMVVVGSIAELKELSERVREAWRLMHVEVSASTRVTLMPAAAGKGLVIGETGKRVLQLAGVSDVLSRTSGQTRTTINYAAATFNALKALNTTRVTQEQRERLHITYGRAI